MSEEQTFLSSHRSHDYKDLVRRWRSIARPAGLAVRKFITQAELDLFYITPRKPRPDAKSIYISTGIHGDEPAAPAGLLYWAEQNPQALAELNLLIFPCLNPWGLINNTRCNNRGRDLNRNFQNNRLPFVRNWRSVIDNQRFDLALNLHEDYDAQGLYIYELQQDPPQIAEKILKKVAPVIPPDARGKIDSSRANNGVIRRKTTLADFEDFGLPEALYLHFNHSEATLTIETPSEYSLFRRAQAHSIAIQTAIDSV